MHPQPEADHADRNQRNDQQRVSHHRAARKRAQDLADHAQRRDKDDIDFRMTKEPEQVLPEQRVAAQVWVEEIGADPAVEHQLGRGDDDGGHRKYHHKGRYQHGPHKHRHAVQCHARRAELEDGDNQLSGGDERRNFGAGDQRRVNIHAVAG